MIRTFRGLLDKFTWHGGARCIPVDEYRRALERGDREVQRLFYAGLMLRNGVYRTTFRYRLSDMFPLLTSLARDLRPKPLRVLDVACSSGGSTAELHEALRAAGIDCETYGSDPLIWADYARRDDGVGMLFDHDGQVLQVDIGKWASPWRWRPRDRVLRPWLYARARRIVEREADAFRACLKGPVPGFKSAKVSLLSSAAEGVPGLHFVEGDILHPTIEGRFGLIRAANILNLGYFDPETIRAMGRALGERLEEDGVLLVVRSEDALKINRGTVFRKRSGRLVTEADANGGSEVKDLIG